MGMGIIEKWEWGWEGMGIDSMGMGGSGNVKSHSRSSLLISRGGGLHITLRLFDPVTLTFNLLSSNEMDDLDLSCTPPAKFGGGMHIGFCSRVLT